MGYNKRVYGYWVLLETNFNTIAKFKHTRIKKLVTTHHYICYLKEASLDQLNYAVVANSS